MRRIPLVRPHLPLLEEIESHVRSMLTSGRLTNFGPFEVLLEEKVKRLLDVKHALCVSNATTGLMLLLNTLPKGSEVLVPSFTFLPTVQAILWNSLVPVFVDIDPVTYNCLPSAILSSITARTSAVLAVHTFGNPCLIDQLEVIAREHKLKLFFDSAHSFGAKHSGKSIGTFGDAEVFSLSATKVLPCGEGGLITTNDDGISQAILNSRNYGFVAGNRDCLNWGLNGKMTEFSAILGVKEIEHVKHEVTRRNQIARKYTKALRQIPGVGFQKILNTDISTYKDFTITIDHEKFGKDRDTLRTDLSGRGIETGTYFSPPIHEMSYFREHTTVHHDLRNTERIAKSILSLPIYFDLSDDDIAYVSDSVAESWSKDKKSIQSGSSELVFGEALHAEFGVRL